MKNSNIPAYEATTPAYQNFPAVWVSGSFAPIDRAFFALALPNLSPRAVRVYMAHLSVASQSTGRSQCYRETLAAAANCSTDTIDRGNTELEHFHLIEPQGTLFRCGGPVVYALTPSCQWVFTSPFGGRKIAEPKPQKGGVRPAKLRHNTKEANKEVLESSMTGVPENSFPHEPVAPSEIVLEQEAPEEAPAAEAIESLSIQLIRHDVRPDQARKWSRQFPDRCEAVLAFVADKPNWGPGLIVEAIKKPSRMKSERHHDASASNAAAFDDWKPKAPPLPTDDERATLRAKVAAHIERCLSLMLPPRRASYELGMAGFGLREKVQYLEHSAPREWDEAGRAH